MATHTVAKSLLEDLPTTPTALSVEEQAKVLNQIAVWSYQRLREVPLVGLAGQKTPLAEIAKVRNWLENSGIPLFLLLSLQLQYALDVSIINEIWRGNQSQLGKIQSPPFKTDSFDQALLLQLLEVNKLDKDKLVTKALSFEGYVTNELRHRNYPIEKYLSGAWFESISPEGKIYEIVTGSMGLSLNQQFSKKQFGTDFFIKVLRAIDRHDEIRLVIQVYLEKSLTVGKVIDVRTDEFEQLVSEKLESSHVFLVSNGDEMGPFHVFNTIEGITPEKRLYTDGLAVVFYPFFTADNRNLLPEEFVKLVEKDQAKSGQWLRLKE
jgi:hypothetical protein